MFFLESKEELNGVSLDTYIRIIKKLNEKGGLASSKIVEAASFSMSMVVRVALGLDSKNAHLAIIIDNTLASRVALACLRQLMNSGASGLIIALENTNFTEEKLYSELKYHEHTQTEVFLWKKDSNHEEIRTLLENQDTIISGLFNEVTPDLSSNLLTEINLLNDLETPIHSIIAPIGINPDNGERNREALISASTLSLGLPLSGLNKGRDQVGRHYLCDISISEQILKENNVKLPILFNEQPVIQIFPKNSA